MVDDAELLASPGSMLAVATAVAALLVLVLFAGRLGAPRTPVPVRALSARERARRAAVIRQGDPDAAGSPRPRAPSHRGPAA